MILIFQKNIFFYRIKNNDILKYNENDIFFNKNQNKFKFKISEFNKNNLFTRLHRKINKKKAEIFFLVII